METIINRFGEKQTRWESHKHPENANFMQVVKYMHIEYTDGRNHLYWRLCNSSANDNHVIYNIALDKAIELYTDSVVSEISEAEFENWLKSQNL